MPDKDIIENKFIKRLSEINIRFRKFSVLNREDVKWLIEGLQSLMGTDELFFPLMITGVKININEKGQVPAYRLTQLGQKSPSMGLANDLVSIALGIAIDFGTKKQLKSKSKIFKPHPDMVANQSKLIRG